MPLYTLFEPRLGVTLRTDLGKFRFRIQSIKLNEFFTLADNTRGTRGHSRKLVKFRCTRDCCKYFFSNRVINRRNQLDQGVVDASSIGAFKRWLDKIRETRMGFFMD